MEIDKKWSGGELKRKVTRGYSPHHLSVEGREELFLFPRNIMFSRFKDEADGSQSMGTSLYEPDLSTFKQGKPIWSMTYRNQYGGNDYVVITLDTVKLSYSGDKFVNGIRVGVADGVIKGEKDEGWDLFFFHLTMLGLSEGEWCELKPNDVTIIGHDTK